MFLKYAKYIYVLPIRLTALLVLHLRQLVNVVVNFAQLTKQMSSRYNNILVDFLIFILAKQYKVLLVTEFKRMLNICPVLFIYLGTIKQASMFWRKRVIAIAAEYPDVELSHMYVDNAAMQLVRNPKQVF